MARKRATKGIRILGKYVPDAVHTLELPQLFSDLRSANIHGSMPMNQDSFEWNGNLTWDESLDAAEFGKWTAPVIEAITLPEITSESEDNRYFYDVTGTSFDMSAHLSGEPESWLVEEPVRKPCGRIIRLAIEIGGNQSVAAQEMTNRGRAIVALINSLELAGHSVELTIVRAYHNARSEHYKFLIPVKHAGQSIDMKRIQFMIGHPAFYRRCLFGLTEIAQGESQQTCLTRTGSYIPSGYFHIPFDAGLDRDSNASLEWARQFAHSLESIAA
jgi:hypothetical protein